MMYIVPPIANPVVGKSPFPDFSTASHDSANGMGISALDELHSMFERYVVGRAKQEMNMLRHYDERVKLNAALTAVAIDCLQEQASVVLDHKESSTLPCRKRHEIGSGRGDESSRLQEQTSAAQAAIFAWPKAARVKLVPFPVKFYCPSFVLEQAKWLTKPSSSKSNASHSQRPIALGGIRTGLASRHERHLLDDGDRPQPRHSRRQADHAYHLRLQLSGRNLRLLRHADQWQSPHGLLRFDRQPREAHHARTAL